MDTYYKILGITPEASQTEIKKAYFKMIRQYSPESDPEQFQKIREAYEYLKKSDNISTGPAFPMLSDPSAQYMADQITRSLQAGDSKTARDTCEKAWKLFPDNIQFLYYLILAQRECGNTGKAVKNAEKLAEREPENKWFQKELAISYMARGFTNKAYFACEKAYNLGCRDIDFILIYASECFDYGEYDTILSILLEVSRQDKKWSKEELPEIFETYLMLAKVSQDRTEYLPEITDRLVLFLEQYRLYIPEYIMEISIIFSNIYINYIGNTKYFSKLGQAFPTLEKACRMEEEKEIVRHLLWEYNFSLVTNDSRLSATMKRAYDAFYGIEGLHPVVLKFALLDTKLCMIEERQEILKQAKIVKKDYPDFYGKMQDFFQTLESGSNLPYVKESLLKSYRKIEPDCSGGFYYKNYPNERPKDNVIYGGDYFEPYIRNAKKIGRNNPCPCGSGKKYKQCCMNK